MSIEQKTSPVEHWIVDGKAYRLATEADIGREVFRSDESFHDAIGHNAIPLVSILQGEYYPYRTVGKWKFAYVQDDSLLAPQPKPDAEPIDWTKPVRTKSKKTPVRIVCTDGPGDYPVVGFIGDSDTAEQWTIDGKYVAADVDDADLENTSPEPKRIRIERWANIYDDGELYWWASKDMAHRYAKKKRFACVKVVIDCEEGEGL